MRQSSRLATLSYGYFIRSVLLAFAGVTSIGIYAADHSANDNAKLQSLTIAAATNFVPVLDQIVEDFESASGVASRVISGSTGKLYAQIANGLNVDVFLAADQARVDLLVDAGLADAESRLTYAIGRLAWWHPGGASLVATNGTLVLHGGVRVIALAQPKLAPYGLAAQQALKNCAQYDEHHVRFVYGENIGQTFVHVDTGNADGGFVSLASLMLGSNRVKNREYVAIPSECHQPINQDGIVLKLAANREQAFAFMNFLQTTTVRETINRAGYAIP